MLIEDFMALLSSKAHKAEERLIQLGSPLELNLAYFDDAQEYYADEKKSPQRRGFLKKIFMNAR